MPRLLVVEVAISWRSLATHCSSEAISSVLMLGIASCRVGSAVRVGVELVSNWAIGIVIEAGIDCWEVLVTAATWLVVGELVSSSAASSSWCYNPPRTGRFRSGCRAGPY